MFKRKQEESVEPEKVSCETCKCLLYKRDAQEVEVVAYSFLYGIGNPRRYYCQAHKKPYSRRLGTKFYAELEVNEDGTPVGYKKIK